MATITGTSGNDTLTGTTQADTIYGGAGNDIIDGVVGTDSLYGQAGDDIFKFSGVQVSQPAPPAGIIDGGDGFDTIDLSNVSPASINLSSYPNWQVTVGNQVFNVTNVESVILGSSANLVFGNSSIDTPIEIHLGGGDDTYLGVGSSKVYGEAGNDTFFVSGQYGTALPAGLVDGGDGIDTLETNINFAVDLSQGTATGINLNKAVYHVANIENVELSTDGYASSAIGDDNSNVLSVSSSGDDGRVGVTFDGRGGDDTITGSAGNDTLSGGSGNDTITGGLGNDLIDGGTGVDTVLYSGHSDQYTVSTTAGVTHISGIEGSDTLTAIEYIQFKDGSTTFDTDSHAAEIMRLYDTVLDRTPDALGLDNWLHAMENGTSFNTIANDFLNSAEFQADTGNLSNADYVEYLYENALGRASDPTGKANWVTALDQGTMSRADVLIGFSESAEHRNETADILAQGLHEDNAVYQEVAALYDTALGRLPDSAGIDNWVGALNNGASLQTVAQAFANSAEFQQKTANLDSTGFVNYLYENTLHRAADPTGLANWVNALDHGGETRADLLIGFAESDEHMQLIASHITNGIDMYL